MTDADSIKANDARKSAEEMDEQRQKMLAYEYLCHLEEAKKWLEACLGDTLPPTTELEENLRNGVYLAKLGNFMAPDVLPLNRIYDTEQRRFAAAGLQFRHTDNINHFLKCLKTMQLPLTFQPETTDIYDKKNMPRVIYCIHALSTHLFKLGKAPQIQDLYGKVNFTDEEIDAVSKELRKYGIQMPAFQKIGGLLTNDMPGDTAALHAAVIAVNQSLSDEDRHAFLDALKNPTVRLENVDPRYVDDYYRVMSRARDAKTQAALDRSLNDSYVPDAYDELLTQAEIQGHVNNVNARRAWESVEEGVRLGTNDLIAALLAPVLRLKHVSRENADSYREALERLTRSPEWQREYPENGQSWRALLRKAIDSANEAADASRKRDQAVQAVNARLQNGTQDEFYRALISRDLGLASRVDEYATALYHEEMKIDRAESKKDLSYDDVAASLRVLSTIAAISKAVDTANPELVYKALSNPDAYVCDLDEENRVKYNRALAAARREKILAGKECTLLTYMDIQECIDLVNRQCEEDTEVIRLLRKLNDAVMESNRWDLTRALQEVSSKLQNRVCPDDVSLYIVLFKKCLEENHADGSELWLEDIESVSRTVASEAEEVQDACGLLKEINVVLDRNDTPFAIKCIRALGVKVTDKLGERCVEALKSLKRDKGNLDSCPYVRYVTSRGNESYLDLETSYYTWDRPEYLSESRYIAREDIERIARKVAAEEVHARSTRINDDAVVRLQARARGYLLRKKIADRYGHFDENEEKIVRIQAWWRAVSARRRYAAMLEERSRRSAAMTANRSAQARTRHRSALERYKTEEGKIARIQALWRGRAARRAFRSLLRLEKPPFSVVRHFSSILNFNAEDYDKELRLQQLKAEVVKAIRHNRNLSQQLDGMDIKIGLLVQNRITLQDVVAHGKSLESLAKEKSAQRMRKSSFSETGATHKGLKSLTKEGRRMLEGYQHLFYALQTNPTYLSKLLFLLPQSKSNKFLENVILTLFNFGSNAREEYLLLKLFRSALQEEIRCKYQKPSEVVTESPLVLKMVVNYARQLNGQKALRQIVGPIIEKVLADKSINIETNPVDIYKCWRNQLEMETGENLDLPYAVSQERALSCQQVQERLGNGIQMLESTVSEFLARITGSRDLIPYGMLYMSKVLNDTLREKFPRAPEKDILKVVGNLIYYHFINAAIVAPDAFDIVTLPVDRSLSNDQRRNLASIAKILQFAASKKGFGEEATHLVRLNPFIIECHEKFKKFFHYCCQIEELDDHFSIHEYTEATLIQKPDIYISLQEICDTHGLLVEYQYQIAPDPLDPLHELLDDLGPISTVASLLGIADAVCEPNVARFGKTEVCLTLTNKFEVPETDETSSNKLFIKTKELLVSVFQFLKGDTLVDALEATSSPIQERLYDVRNTSMSTAVDIIRRSSSLNDCKLQLRTYLNKLELGGWVSRADGYQNIVTAVARDLCNKSKYRMLRVKELKTLRATKQRLDEKTRYYEEQVHFYNEYIQRCLENLSTGKGSLHALKTTGKGSHGRLKSKMTLKYSAAKLQEKGVLLEVDGLPSSQFKNVIFEISPTEHNGIFTVRGKFMGVEMEKLDVDIQKLLELQFEGAPIMDMFGKAKINVNLLLYLLNRKFYGKT